MSIRTVRDKLKERLDTIKGLNGHAYPPNRITKLPVAIVDYDAATADYQQPGGTAIWRFRILLLIANWEASMAYETLDDYIEKSGSKSIKAALEPSPNAVGDYCVVQNCENAGPIRYKAGEQIFYGCEFVVEVGDTI